MGYRTGSLIRWFPYFMPFYGLSDLRLVSYPTDKTIPKTSTRSSDLKAELGRGRAPFWKTFSRQSLLCDNNNTVQSSLGSIHRTYRRSINTSSNLNLLHFRYSIIFHTVHMLRSFLAIFLVFVINSKDIKICLMSQLCKRSLVMYFLTEFKNISFQLAGVYNNYFSSLVQSSVLVPLFYGA